MGTTLGEANIPVVVDGEKNMCRLVEIGQSGAGLLDVGFAHHEKGNRGA